MRVFKYKLGKTIWVANQSSPVFYTWKGYMMTEDEMKLLGATPFSLELEIEMPQMVYETADDNVNMSLKIWIKQVTKAINKLLDK